MEGQRGPDGRWRAGGAAQRIDIDPAVIARILKWGAGALLALIVVFSSFYTVEPEEKAVVLRFGRYVETTEPGLHWKLPLGIDKAIKVPVTRVQKLEFGFGSTDVGVRTQYRQNTEEDRETKLMLTGDLNLVSIDWVVQYQILQPKDWLFNLHAQEKTIRDLAESAMRAVVGEHSIDEVLVGRESIAGLSQSELQRTLNDYESGVQILTVQLQDVTPPEEVAQSFNEVNKAEQERSRAENEAMQDYNRVIPLARGEAKKRIAESEGYAIDRVNRAKGAVAQFEALRLEYERAPRVTRHRMYMEMLEAVLPNVSRIIVADDAGGVLKLLPLDGGGPR